MHIGSCLVVDSSKRPSVDAILAQLYSIADRLGEDMERPSVGGHTIFYCDNIVDSIVLHVCVHVHVQCIYMYMYEPYPYSPVWISYCECKVVTILMEI